MLTFYCEEGMMDVSLMRAFRRKAKLVIQLFVCCSIVVPAIWFFIFPRVGSTATSVFGIAAFVLFDSAIYLLVYFALLSDFRRILKISAERLPADFDESMIILRSYVGRGFGRVLTASFVVLLLATAMAMLPEISPFTHRVFNYYLEAIGLVILGTTLGVFWLFFVMQLLAAAPRFWVKALWIRQGKESH